MSAIENYKKPNSLRVEEFEVLGEKLNEIYINTIGRAQKAQGKFLFTVKENENKNEKICSLDNLLCAIWH